MTKKLFSVLLAIVMLLTVAPVAVFAEDDILSYLTYEINDGEVTITGCDESITGDVVIPDTIDGCPVTAIGSGAFGGCGMKTIDIPYGVVSIGRYAFDLCTQMTDIIIPESVNRIEEGAFYTCCSLTTVELPSALTEISFGLFGDCFRLEHVNIPLGVTSIGGCAFTSCHSLTEIDIPDGVVFIGYSAFAGTALKEITLPDNLKSIGEHAFWNCYKLKNIHFPNAIQEIPDYVCFNCFSLETVILPENVQAIGCESFSGCYSLSEIILPDSVTAIGESAFRGCISLKNVTIPKSVSVVGSYAFFGCNSVKSISIDNYKTALHPYAVGYTNFELLVEREVWIQAWINCYDEGIFIKNDEGEIIGIQEYPSIYDNADKDDYIKTYNQFQCVDNFEIHGYANSTAETYANKHTIKFIPYSCEHHYSEENIVIKEPTYLHTGLKGKACIYCGDALGTEEIPTLDIASAKECKSSETDVSILYPDGTFGDNIELGVVSVENGDAYQIISHKQGNYKATMFDMYVFVDGKQVQPNGTVLVKMPLPKGYNQNKCAVYYVAADGSLEELETYHFKDGYVYFETNHFSYYAIIEEEVTANRPSWMDDTLNFVQAFIDFFNKIISWFRTLFGIA